MLQMMNNYQLGLKELEEDETERISLENYPKLLREFIKYIDMKNQFYYLLKFS